MAELFQQRAKLPAKPKSPTIPTTTARPADDMVAEIDKVIGNRIIHGANEVIYPVDGKTVAYVRQQLSAVLNAPHDAAAYINGVRVKDETTTIIGQEEIVEFIKSSGIKGSI